MFASAQYNHWEDDDYNRYLSDLFWDDMFDTAPDHGCVRRDP